MVLVTSRFSKKIDVIGERNELELLFESLKVLRSRNKSLHSKLLKQIKKIVIIGDDIDSKVFELPPYGITIEKDGATLTVHPESIRLSSSWMSALIAFRVSALEFASSTQAAKKQSENLSMGQLYKALDKRDLIRKCWNVAKEHLEIIDAPRQEILHAKQLVEEHLPQTIVPALWFGNKVPLPDYVSDIENFSDFNLEPLFRLVARAEKKDSLLAKQLDLAKQYSNYIVLVPGIASNQTGQLDWASIGLLIKVKPLDFKADNPKAIFDLPGQRVEIKGYKTIDGVVLANISEPEGSLEPSEEELVKLTEIKGNIEEITKNVFADDANITHHKKLAESPLPDSSFAAIGRALQITNSPTWVKRQLFLTKQILGYLDMLEKRTRYYAKRSSDMILSEVPIEEGRSALSPALQQWFEGICLITYHQQSRLSTRLNRSSWQVDLVKREIVFPEAQISFRCDLLASSNEQQKDWLWSWGNRLIDISEETIKLTRKLKEIGNEYNIPELITPHLEFYKLALIPDAADIVHSLSMLGTALLGAEGYYLGSNGGTTTVFLLYDNSGVFSGESHLGSIANEVSLYLPSGLSTFQLRDHKKAIGDYLSCLSDSSHYQEDKRQFTALLKDGSCIEISLDENNLLAQVQSKQIQQS